MSGSHGASGREEMEGRECGNKDGGGGKGKEMESGSFAQPSITSLVLSLFGIILLVVVSKTHRKRERS